MSTVLKGVTLSEYLQQEERTGCKHEYFRGEIFAMVGGTPRHSLIATNFAGESRQRLAGNPCVAYNCDLRIKVDRSGLYTYPDASIICGELELDTELSNTVLNPTVLIEVLSESTEKYDRGQKSSHYRMIPSLKQLVLISQEQPSIECFSRHESGGWMLHDYRGLDANLALESVGISIPLAEIYRGVSFEPAEHPTNEIQHSPDKK